MNIVLGSVTKFDNSAVPYLQKETSSDDQVLLSGCSLLSRQHHFHPSKLEILSSDHTLYRQSMRYLVGNAKFYGLEDGGVYSNVIYRHAIQFRSLQSPSKVC